MANFEKIICWLLYQEDSKKSPGKVVDLQDGAGLTRLGLTQRWHQKDVPLDFFSTMSFGNAVQVAKQAYRKQYWNVIDGDLINSDLIAAMLLSFSVNDNSLIAVEVLQRVLGVDVDGHIGPGTLSELNSKDPAAVAEQFRLQWIDFYHQIVKIAPSKQQFLNGWIARAKFPFPSSEVLPIYDNSDKT